jgi:hypothetical protein
MKTTFKEIHSNLDDNAQVRFVHGMSTTQKALTGRSANENTQKAASNKIQRLNKTIEGNNTDIIAQKDVIERLNLPESCKRGNFNGLRGQNKWDDSKHLTVAGRTMANSYQVARMAAATTNQWLDPDQDYTRTVKPIFNAEGQAIGKVNALKHPDPTAEAIREQIAEAELSQAIHRARPINNDATIDVIANDVVPKVPFTETKHIKDIEPSPIDIAMQRGILPDSYRGLYPVVADHYSTIKAVARGCEDKGEFAPNFCRDIYREMGQTHGYPHKVKNCTEWKKWRLKIKSSREHIFALVEPNKGLDELRQVFGDDLESAYLDPSELFAEWFNQFNDEPMTVKQVIDSGKLDETIEATIGEVSQQRLGYLLRSWQGTNGSLTISKGNPRQRSARWIVSVENQKQNQKQTEAKTTNNIVNLADFGSKSQQYIQSRLKHLEERYGPLPDPASMPDDLFEIEDAERPPITPTDEKERAHYLIYDYLFQEDDPEERKTILLALVNMVTDIDTVQEVSSYYGDKNRIINDTVELILQNKMPA